MSLPVEHVLPLEETKRKRKYVKKALIPITTEGLFVEKPKRKPSAYNLFVQSHLKSPELVGINQKEKMRKVAEMRARSA